MPARKLSCTIVAVLLLTSACTDDSTSPEGTLTVEEILQVSQRMSEVLLSGLSEIDDPDSGILGSGIDIPCAGGTVNLVLSIPEIRDAGQTVSFDYEAKPDGCVLSGEDIVIWGNPSIAGGFTLSFLDGIEEMEGEITFTGSLRYTAVNDGRNGTCDIDLVESSMRTTTETTFSWKGTVCGIGIDHSDQRP